MREILFKGKRANNGEWIRGDSITTPFIRRETQQNIIYILDITKADYDCFEDLVEDNGIFEVDPETVCQYTGLTDKNGKQIFEGDIIQYNKKLFKVVWVSECAHFAAHPLKECSWSPCMNIGTVKNAEVIGNIFDNPDLLEEAGNE